MGRLSTTECTYLPTYLPTYLDSRWIAYGMADTISKPAWRYTIGSTPEFWVILSSQNDPLLGPQFHPPRVVNWRPHISLPNRSPDPSPGCTLR